MLERTILFGLFQTEELDKDPDRDLCIKDSPLEGKHIHP